MPKALTRRRIGAGLALAIAIAIVLIVVLNNGPATAGAANNAALSNNPGVTSVQRRDLVETDTESGTLSYANPQTVYNNLSGTITWLPQVGQLIKPGQTLYKVDGVSVMLMNGSTPAFRDLSADDTNGPDILELNRNLISLGFNPDGIVADDQWQAATTAGVDVLQAYLGQTETGILSLGQVVFLPGAQLVSQLDEALGADPGGSTSGASLSTSTTLAGGPEFVDLHTGTTTTPGTTTTTQTTTPKRSGAGQGHGSHSHSCHGKRTAKSGRTCSHVTSLQALIALLKAEIAELRAEKAGRSGGGGASGSGSGQGAGSKGGSGSGGSGSAGSGSSGSGSGGSSGGAGSSGGGTGSSTAVLQTTSRQLVVTVDLDASKQSEAKVGEKVTVEMPSANVVNGTISAVSSVATSSSSGSSAGAGAGSGGSGGSGGGGGGANSGTGGSSSSIPVTVTLKHTPRGAGLDQAAVSVNFAEAQAKNVLSVPVTALVAVPGGGYALQEAAAPHKLVKVTTGLFAAGFVQVSGPQVTDGLQVTNSEG